MRRTLLIIGCSAHLALGVLLSTGESWGAETTEEQSERAMRISRTTMSPFCPGRTLDSCPSGDATSWRDDIRRWIAEGVATDEIRRRLGARLPDQDLTGAPRTALDNILPGAVVVTALALLVLLLRALVRSRAAPGAAAPESETALPLTPAALTPTESAELDRRLDAELEDTEER